MATRVEPGWYARPRRGSLDGDNWPWGCIIRVSDSMWDEDAIWIDVEFPMLTRQGFLVSSCEISEDIGPADCAF